jgi:hypothetical protein
VTILRSRHGHTRGRPSAVDRHPILVLDKFLLNTSITETLSPFGHVFADEVHYANRTKEDLEAFELDYEEILRNGIEIVMRGKLLKFHQTYFFQKALDWQQEQEYRWVLIAEENTPEHVYVDTFKSLRYIIVGMDCASVYFPSLTMICEAREIPIGQLVWKSGQPFFTGSTTSALLKATYKTRS